MLPAARAPHAASLRCPAAVANRELWRISPSKAASLHVILSRADNGNPVRSPRGDTVSSCGELGPKSLTVVRTRMTNCEVPRLVLGMTSNRALFLIKDFHRVPGIVGRLLLVLQRAFEVHLGQIIFRIKLEITGK